MTTFDFDTLPARRGTRCVKWDETAHDGVLPFWVADMDFRAAPCVARAVQERAAHGVYGYVHVGDSYGASLSRWFATRHGWQFDPAHVLHTNGVVSALSCCLRALTQTGDSVLLCTPVYDCFYTSVRNVGCQVTESPLEVGADGLYHVRWEHFEACCADERTTVFVLCNPHNPGGRVWTEDELRRVGAICRQHHVTVVADEIHGELTLPGFRHTPFASLPGHAEHCVTCTSASKAFNLAGLQMAGIICADDDLRRRIDRVINLHEVCDANCFGLAATLAAYTDEGAAWLHDLRAYLADNLALLQRRLEPLPLSCMPTQGTYLAWVDARKLMASLHLSRVAGLTDMLERRGGVKFTPGTHYGRTGEGWLRINFACPRAMLDEGLSRLAAFVSAHSGDGGAPETL